MLSRTDNKEFSVSSSTPPTLLAWCSDESNNISVIDLETKQSYTNFDGSRNYEAKQFTWTHVKEIPNTKLLVSLHHRSEKSANMEIFDISKKGKANKIYSLGRIAGNSDISSFDFNPAGESVATINCYETCLISDVNTNNYVFHIGLKSQDEWHRCRWSTNTGEPFLFVKYNQNKLNIVDVEKKVLTLTNPVEIDQEGGTYWIDVCQSNANLLASGGDNSIIRIFDKRESKIVKTFEGIHSGYIFCVRWNPSGDMIASASADKKVKLLDFKTGKVLHIDITSDGRPAYSVCFI